MSALGVCLSLAAALQGTPAVFVPVTQFTLAWTHSIEKVRWEEDYRVELDPLTQLPVLHATAARIQGSAAGMEPPPTRCCATAGTATRQPKRWCLNCG